MLDAVATARPTRRPSILTVVPWAAAGWLVGGLIAVAPTAALDLLGAEIGDTVWQPSADGGTVHALALVVALTWGVVIAQRFTLRQAGPRVAWTWLIAWALPIALALLLPQAAALAIVVAGILALPWVVWDDDGEARPDPLRLAGRGAWSLGVAVPLLAVAAVLAAG